MLRVADNLWVGDSTDESKRNGSINAVLVVAHDMFGHAYMDEENAQVGLIDGPGNPLCAYHAAVLTLVSLLKRGKGVLVCDHDGGRALAVVMMYRYMMNEAPSWDEQVKRLNVLMPHSAHKRAFERMDWTMLRRVISDEVNGG